MITYRKSRTLIPAILLLTITLGCAEDNPVVEDVPEETVTVPEVPTGPATILPDSAATFVSGGAESSFDHTVEYQFDFGDGRHSVWSSAPEVTTQWPAEGHY